MTEATIGCSKEVKRLVESVKGKDETYNSILRKLVENYESDGKQWTESEIERIVESKIRDYQ